VMLKQINNLFPNPVPALAAAGFEFLNPVRSGSAGFDIFKSGTILLQGTYNSGKPGKLREFF